MNNQDQDSGNAEHLPERGFEALRVHVVTHKLDALLWTLRVVTIFLAIGCMIPIYWNSNSLYYKVLVANAAISAVRLHQRVPRFQFNKEYFRMLVLEDSCHYLFYSIIFLYVTPVGVIILPIALFCILHAASYSLTLLDTLGQNSWWGARLLISLVEFQSRSILRLISFTEIVLMPITIILLIMGKAGLLTPFIYYHFLLQRYTSRRNPYTRNMFHELKVTIESLASRPNLPSILQKALRGFVGLVSKLAPQPIATQ